MKFNVEDLVEQGLVKKKTYTSGEFAGLYYAKANKVIIAHLETSGHLLKAKEMLGMRLCVLHNLYFYNHMMEEIRDALDAGNFAAYKKMRLEGFEEGRINGNR